MRRCGTYYHSADFFYHELWKDRLRQAGFRVITINKIECHHVWDIRLCGTLSAQCYLLLTKPVPKRPCEDLLLKQLRLEIQHIAKDLGPPIKADCMSVTRIGGRFRVSFIWPLGKPGQLLEKDKKPAAFSFLIRPWVRRNRN